MKTIVAPTDFSEISLNAVNYAADMACVISTELSLLHVCLIPMTFSEVPAPAYTVQQQVADAVKQMEQLREKVFLRSGGRLKINTEVRPGNVVQEIDNYCGSVNTYAVVMGAESTGPVERILLGGKTISAVRQFSWPLIVVPPGVKFSSIQKIGLACDFRNVVETIPLKEIKELVDEFHAEFHVLHVTAESGTDFSDETIEESGWLQDIIGELKPKYHFIKGGQVENKIIEFTEKNNLDLLIIIPKKHNLLSNIFRHSYSKHLVLHSHVPVMAIHE